MSIVTYYCGENSLVRVSTDEGIFGNWVTRSVPGSVTLYDIMAWPGQPNKATTVGSNGAIYTTINTGVLWSDASPVYGTSYTFEEVWNIDPLNSVIAGWKDIGEGSFRPVFVKSIDGGFNYTEGLIRDAVNVGIDIFEKGKATSIHFLSDQVGVMGVLGTFNNNLPPEYMITANDSCYVLITLDGGLTWEVTNNKQPLNLAAGNFPYGIKVSYDNLSTEYIINVVTQANIFRSINTGLTYNITDNTTKGQHLTWIGDTNVWYTEQSADVIKQSTNLGSTWATLNPLDPIPVVSGRAAHFYQAPLIITGFYSSGIRLFKSVNQVVPGTPSDVTPMQEQIWAVWTEQDNPFKCYLLQNCQDPSIQYIFTDDGFIGSCGFDFSSNIGNTVIIESIIPPNPCPEVADGATCWLIVQEAPCGSNFCNQIIP